MNSQQQRFVLEASLETDSFPGVEGLVNSCTHLPVLKTPERKKWELKQTNAGDERCQTKKANDRDGGAR